MMSQPLVVAQSGAMPVDLDQAFHVAFWMDAPMLPVFDRLWRGYARQSLEALSKQLVT